MMMSDEERIERLSGMNDEIAIHDLEEIRDYFLEETGGCCPICLDYAIARLKVLTKEERK